MTGQVFLTFNFIIFKSIKDSIFTLKTCSNKKGVSGVLNVSLWNFFDDGGHI